MGDEDVQVAALAVDRTVQIDRDRLAVNLVEQHHTYQTSTRHAALIQLIVSVGGDVGHRWSSDSTVSMNLSSLVIERSSRSRALTLASLSAEPDRTAEVFACAIAPSRTLSTVCRLATFSTTTL